MRSSAIIIATFAATALSGPVQLKRAVVTEWEYQTVTEIVYVNGPPPTPVPEQHETPKEHHHEHSVQHSQGPPNSKETSSVEVAPAPLPTSETPTPEPTPEPAPEPAPEATTEAAPAPIPEPTTEAPAPSPTPEPTPEAPAPTPSSPAPEPSSSPAPSTDEAHYQELVLHHHNVHRANHSAPDLAWRDDLANAAKMLAETCVFAHNTHVGMDENYGQNLAGSAPSANITAQITEGWYNSEIGWFNGQYGKDSPDMTNFERWGHASQLVWKSSTHVGCYTNNCMGTALGMYYTVCNYLPTGNVSPQYASNVLEPRGDATSHWNDLL